VPIGAAPIGQPVGGSASVLHSYVFEDRDWLQLSPQASGTADVQLLINGSRFGSLPIVAVAMGEVSAIRILNQDESHAKNGDWLVSYAQAVDTTERPILGVEYTWQLDQTMQKGIGDLFRYEYDARQPKMLTASVGAMAAQTFIHAKKGFVDTTNHVGCSTAPGAHRSAQGAILGSGLFFALLVLRATQRRRRRAGAA
jgi:hypothetical protein